MLGLSKATEMSKQLPKKAVYAKFQMNTYAKEKIDADISKITIEKDGKTLELTKNEIKILHFLVGKRGQIVSREDIMSYLWDSESFIDDNTLTVNMTRLRNKLEELGLKELIETKRGQGYILN